MTLTHTGLVHVSPGFATPRTMHNLVPTVVKGLMEAILSMGQALQQWRRLGFGVCPMTRLPCSAAIRVRMGPSLSIE